MTKKETEVVYPSWETIKRSLFRALYTMIGSGLTTAILITFSPTSFGDFRAYGQAVLFAFIVGAVMGFWKFVSGYLKYDV